MTWLAIRAFFGGLLKAGLSAISRFFVSLNAQGWIGLIACGLLAFLFIRAEGESRHWKKQSRQFERLYRADHAELQRLSATRAVQRQVTRDNIETANRTIKGAEERARVVEIAPPAKDCRTKPEVMNADV